MIIDSSTGRGPIYELGDLVKPNMYSQIAQQHISKVIKVTGSLLDLQSTRDGQIWYFEPSYNVTFIGYEKGRKFYKDDRK